MDKVFYIPHLCMLLFSLVSLGSVYKRCHLSIKIRPFYLITKIVSISRVFVSHVSAF